MAVNHNMVAHIWANRSKDRATGYAMFFEEATIYSHGHHFPIARHVEHNGKRAVLFTTRSYSVSTGKHKSIVRSAIRGDAQVFHVDRVGELDHKRQRSEYQARILGALAKASRARTYVNLHLDDARRTMEEGNAYSEFYGLRWRLKLPADHLAAVRAAQEKAARAQKLADAKRARELAEAVPLWLAGERVALHNHPDTFLRVKGDTVETSRGAVFPVEHARRAFRLIAQCRANGGAWQRNGHSIHLGHFQIDRIAATGDVRAGCHFVKWSEIARVAAELGLDAATAAA